MGLERFNTNSKNARKTVFCDIDGTLVKFPESFNEFKDLPKGKHKMELLPGTLDKLWEWETSGYNIILTTGRKESMRPETERQLKEAGIFWDHLIMGLGPGPRYLINDKNAGNDTAFAINVERNEGIQNVDLQSKATPVSDRSQKYYGEAAEAEAIRIAEVNYQRAKVDFDRDRS
jgi:hypothetical protein